MSICWSFNFYLFMYLFIYFKITFGERLLYEDREIRIIFLFSLFFLCFFLLFFCRFLVSSTGEKSFRPSDKLVS